MRAGKVLAVVVLMLALLVPAIPAAAKAPAADLPSNDLCEDAVVVPAEGPFPWKDTPRDTTSYGTEGASICGGIADAWWTFTPATSGIYKFAAGSSAAEPIVTVYAGTCGNLSEILCMHTPGRSESSAAVDLDAGTKYYIRVAGSEASAGVVPFKVRLERIRYPAPPVLYSFAADPDGKTAWGIGFNEDMNTVWVSTLKDRVVREFSARGDMTGAKMDGFWADMEYDSGRKLMYQVDVNNDRAIHTWNPRTGEFGPVITDPAGIWTAPDQSQRGVAYDPQTDTLYVGGWNQDKVYHIQGLSWPQPGAIIQSWDFAEVAGLAWLGEGRMIVITNDFNDGVHLVNAETMKVIDSFVMPEGVVYSGAGIDAEPDGACWLTNQSTGKAYRVAMSTVLMSPTGGETLTAGTTHKITWLPSPKAESYKLKYSLDDGKTWNSIPGTFTGDQYNWTVPTVPGNKDKCLVKVVAFDANGKRLTSAVSNRPFTIEVLTLTAPSKGQVLNSGDPFMITWKSYLDPAQVGQVKLAFSKDGGVSWNSIDTVAPGVESYNWTVPDVQKQRLKCKVKIVLKDAAGKVLASDVSDGVFTVRPRL